MQALPRPANIGKTCEAERGKVEFNPRVPDKYLPHSKSLEADVYTSTEWTGGCQDHLLCFYLLTIPTSQNTLKKPVLKGISRFTCFVLCDLTRRRIFSLVPPSASLVLKI